MSCKRVQSAQKCLVSVQTAGRAAHNQTENEPFSGGTALPLELHFSLVRYYYNVRCWIWKWKHFFSLFVSSPESHEDRRKKAIMQLDYESCDTLHGLEGEEKVKRGRMLEELGIEELRLRKRKAEPLCLFSPSSVLCSQQQLWSTHKNGLGDKKTRK